MVSNILRVILLAAVCALAPLRAFAGDSEAALLMLTEGKLHDVFALAWGADAGTLDQWAKSPAKSGANEKEFCPDYERDDLSELFRSMADYKRSGVAADAPSEPHAVARLAVFKLMSFRPTPPERLKQALELAKAVAPPDGKTAKNAATFLRALEHPATNMRVPLDWKVAQCLVDRKVIAVYPDEMKFARIQGTVIVRVVVGTDGKVKTATIVRGHPGLTYSARGAASATRYRPYFLLGRPVEFETQVTINFTIE